MKTEIGIYWCKDCNCSKRGDLKNIELESPEDKDKDIKNCPYSTDNKKLKIKRLGTKTFSSVSKFSGSLKTPEEKKAMLKERSRSNFQKEGREVRDEMWRKSGLKRDK